MRDLGPPELVILEPRVYLSIPGRLTVLKGFRVDGCLHRSGQVPFSPFSIGSHLIVGLDLVVAFVVILAQNTPGL